MTITFKRNGKGADELKKKLEKAKKFAQKEAAKKLKVESDKLQEDVFSSGQGPFGENWEKPQDGGRPLVDSGKLAKQASKGKAGAGKVKYKVSVPYGAYHQFGTDEMPARPFAPLAGKPPKLDKAVQDILNDGMSKALNA